MKKPVTKRGVLPPLLHNGSGLTTVLLALALAVCLLAVPAAAASCTVCGGCDGCGGCEDGEHYDCGPGKCGSLCTHPSCPCHQSPTPLPVPLSTGEGNGYPNPIITPADEFGHAGFDPNSRHGFRTSGIIHVALDPVAAGEEENIKLWWDEDTRSQRGAEDFARSRSMWRDIPAGYGYLQSMLNFLEGPDGYTGGATVTLKVAKSQVTDRDYQLTDITVVQFRNITSNTTPIAFPYEETLRLADVLEQKLRTDKENPAGVLNAIDTIRKELDSIQENAGGSPVDQEKARDLYRQMYDLVREHYPDYVINAWVKVPARILFDDETVNDNRENWGSVILQAELSELDGPVTIIFLKGNDLTTALERPVGA
ncbi:MAG TPA: hypothetical protein O0Y06_03995 [Methanocorpusculum sp.]|nr:hypothetical protein [Methanocorpusculum sp.]HJK80046.1 hypothetical protein [Methanocorpusculum sp.]